MNKNWGDRADKDLFFTILSVKNIGVITGAEWSTIGNTMRMMRYGFTNEGCRQHFQGLRRAQHKAATAANLLPDGSFKHDPSQNPITRRPGPGRGRPRKNAAVKPADGQPVASVQVPAPVVSQGPRQLLPAPPGGPPQALQPSYSYMLPQHGPPSAPVAPMHLEPQSEVSYETNGSTQRPPPAPMTENDDAPGEDEPPSKRQRVDGDEIIGTIVTLTSSQLEEESADDLEDDDEEEELFSQIDPSTHPAGADKDDVASNHDAEDAVLTLVAAGDGQIAAVSNASSPSWETPTETTFEGHVD
ncbi:uncharacterized protein B0I36DRAFT_344287 [Microdochium trichocladiopsis]|uniref:Myb-like domain-containing protein n=1 Tax=Microdochium trichocladiopsis TaxID=1682393 RepID=A0A9P9BWG0_9PEZI|nr:uncharacterized protein B0I36DRAFT_344287 [Microdochium trichocladiopsis]KAH7040560.1 hypothetical protein B0I36DRAFT_344287 [Microdochium trichocladiopsis]